MGHQIIKQPDGKYLIWSTIVDDIIVYDADREEVIEYFIEKAAERARRETDQSLDLIDEGWTSRLGTAYDEVAPRLESLRKSAQEARI